MSAKYQKVFLLIFFIPFNIYVNSCCSLSKNTWIPRSFNSYMSRTLFLKQSLFYDEISSNHNEDVFKKKEAAAKKYNLEIFFLKDNTVQKQTPTKQTEQAKSVEKNKKTKTVKLLSFVVDYMQSFGGDFNSYNNLGSMPFWSGTNILKIGNNDGSADLDAYQLGLGDVAKDNNGKTKIGSIILDPKVKHIGGDIMFYLAKSNYKPGWFFKFNIPIGTMIIHPNFKELTPTTFTNELNYTQTTDNPLSSNIVYSFSRYPLPEDRHNSLIDFFLGGSNDPSVLDGNTYKILRLKKGRVAYQKQEFVRIGDIALSLGWNPFANEKGLFGIGFKCSCPTGNKPTADYILEPIFGRAGLWGVGIELSGHYRVWQKDDNKYFDINAESELLSLRPGKTYTYRSFDLKKNGPGSKYLLIQHYPAIRNNFIESRVGEHVQHAINITTLPVRSIFAFEGSCALAGNYHCNNWNFCLGAELWGRTQEKLKIDIRSAIDERFPNLNDFAVLGRQISSYNIQGQGVLPTYYCEPLARINKSHDPVTLVGTVPSVSKPNTSDLPTGIADARESQNRIPEHLDEALDICGAQASSVMTVKLFSHYNYIFKKRACKPSLGIMAGVELNGHTNNSIQLWNIAIKGSLLF